MVQLQDRPTITEPRPDLRIAEWVTGGLAALMAAIGAWLYWGPEEGVLQVFAWEWSVGDIHTGWGLGLMMAAALFGAIAVALVTTRRTR